MDRIGAGAPTGGVARLPFAELDCFSPAQFPDSHWLENLAAVHSADAPLAEAMRQTVLPAHWRGARGLDGAATWRLEPEGAAPIWLAGAAAPTVRAEGLLSAYSRGEKNPALTAIGAGAEIALLLTQLGPLRALYVFLEELLTAAAVLRCYNFSEALQAGRLILLSPTAPRERLERQLAQAPGLAPPGELLPLPGAAPQRIDELKALCSDVLESIGRLRGAALRALAEQRGALELPTAPSALILSLSGDLALHALCSDLQVAAQEVGIAAREFSLRGPADVGPLARLERLRDFRASMTLAVGRAAVPVNPPDGLLLHWNTDAYALCPLDEPRMHLAASPQIADALRAAGVADERLLDFYWALKSDEFPPPAPAPASPVVYLIGDVPNDTPEACGIDQTTHKLLWKTIAIEVESLWERETIGRAPRVLEIAERRCGVRLRDEAIRARFCRILQGVLIPAVSLRTIHRRLLDAGINVVTHGLGWRESRMGIGEAAGMIRWPENIATPSAAIFAGRPDPLTPALLRAAARGWRVLLHEPAGAAQLGDVLRSHTHYGSFVDWSELKKQAQSATPSPGEIKRRERAREHLWRSHRYQHRWRALLEWDR